MKIMTTHSSATALEESPHAAETTQITISNALRRRAEAVINDSSINPEWRAIVRYALEIKDPWLADLVRRADAGEAIIDALDLPETPETGIDLSSEEKVQALTELICRAGDEPETKSAALLVLMAAVENSAQPKVLVNTAKHLAFNRCADLNLGGMLDAQIALLESELLA